MIWKLSRIWFESPIFPAEANSPWNAAALKWLTLVSKASPRVMWTCLWGVEGWASAYHPWEGKNSCPLCLTYFPDIPYFPHTYFHHTTSHIPYSLWLLGFPHLVAAPLDRVPQKEHRSFQVISSDAGNPCMGVKVLPFLSLWFFFPHVQIIRKLHTPMSNWAMTYWSLLSADTPYSPRVLIRSFHELHFMRPVEVKC